jgi:predicted nucleic acid-binding protein
VRFLLDTNVVSNLRKRKPHPRLVAWLSKVSHEEVFMCAPTISEIQCGIEQTEEPAIAAEVEKWLTAMLEAGYPSVIPFDATAARIFGKMWATPSLNNFVRNDPRQKKLKSGADLAVAACAIARGMVVVTDDSDYRQIHDEFPFVGLYSPFEEIWHVEPSSAALTL